MIDWESLRVHPEHGKSGESTLVVTMGCSIARTVHSAATWTMPWVPRHVTESHIIFRSRVTCRHIRQTSKRIFLKVMGATKVSRTN